jgi:hypothetical protein
VLCRPVAWLRRNNAIGTRPIRDRLDRRPAVQRRVRGAVSPPHGRDRPLENFTRLEVFGFPEAHWIRIVVDPADPGVFSFKAEIGESNRYRAR